MKNSTKMADKNKPAVSKKIIAGERVLLALVDHRTDDEHINKAAYYAGLHAKKHKERVALLYVREDVTSMQLFGVSDVMRQESKEESHIQLTRAEENMLKWFGKKAEIASYVRDGDVSQAVIKFIDKNRFVSGLVVSNWQLENIAKGLHGYISGAKMRHVRPVPVVVVPEDITLSQLDEVYGV